MIGKLEDAALFGGAATGGGAGTTGIGSVSGETGGTENMLSYGSAEAGFGASVCAGGRVGSTAAGARSATPNMRVNSPACRKAGLDGGSCGLDTGRPKSCCSGAGGSGAWNSAVNSPGLDDRGGSGALSAGCGTGGAPDSESAWKALVNAPGFLGWGAAGAGSGRPPETGVAAEDWAPVKSRVNSPGCDAAG